MMVKPCSCYLRCTELPEYDKTQLLGYPFQSKLLDTTGSEFDTHHGQLVLKQTSNVHSRYIR